MARSYSWAVQLSLCITGRHDADLAGEFYSGAPWRWEWGGTAGKVSFIYLQSWLCWPPEGMTMMRMMMSGSGLLFCSFHSKKPTLNLCYVTVRHCFPEFPLPHSELLRSSSYWRSLQTVLPWPCSCPCLKKTATTPIQVWWVKITTNPSHNLCKLYKFCKTQVPGPRLHCEINKAAILLTQIQYAVANQSMSPVDICTSPLKAETDSQGWICACVQQNVSAEC